MPQPKATNFATIGFEAKFGLSALGKKRTTAAVATTFTGDHPQPERIAP